MSLWKRILIPLAIAMPILGTVAWFDRSGLGEYHNILVPEIADPHPRALIANWIGTSGLILRDGDNTIIIDPFFTRPTGLLPLLLNFEIEPDEELIKYWLARVKVASADLVIVSHSHYDHVMDAGIVARQTGARLIGSRSTINVGRGASLPEDQMALIDPDSSIRIGKFEIRFVESAHAGFSGGHPTGNITQTLTPPANYKDYKLGGTWSILIEHPQGSILHHASAGFIPGALENYRADVAFLGIAGIDEIDSYLRETVGSVGATRVVPIHWDDFTKPLDQALLPIPLIVDLEGFLNYPRRTGATFTIHTMLPDNPVVLFPDR